MLLLKFSFILLIALIIAPLDAGCRKKSKCPCGRGKSPLASYFCGRGPTHQDCPATYECIIAPNDAYAVCCPRSKKPVTKTTKSIKKPGTCPKSSTGMGSCDCRYDNDCPDNQKCCGTYPRTCLRPIE